MSPRLFAVIAILCFVLVRMFTVIIHEMGHALAVVILTKERVQVFIGSTGNRKNTVKLNIGLLEIFLYRNPLFWQYGVCIPYAKNVSKPKKIAYLLAGSLTSLVVASISLTSVFTFEFHGFLKVLGVLFFISALLDLISNWVPMQYSTTTDNGNVLYNDGEQIRQLLVLQKNLKQYYKAVEFYNSRQFDKASVIFEWLIKRHYYNEAFFMVLQHCYVNLDNDEKAEQNIKNYESSFTPSTDDYNNFGLIYAYKNKYLPALNCFEKALVINPEDRLALANKAFELNVLERYDEAILIFDELIKTDESDAYAYANRGLSKIKLSDETNGLDDIKKAIRLDANSAYAYRNLGIYHMDRNEIQLALEQFLISKEKNKDVYNVDVYVSECQQKLAK